MDKAESSETKAPGAIDYDHIDVASIMDQVRKRAADTPPGPAYSASAPAEAAPTDEEREALLRSLGEPGSPPAPGPEAEPSGWKGRIKRLVLKLLRPFFPLMRLLGLPLHQDIRATQKILHETNKRLDHLYALFHLREVRVDQRFHAIEENAEAASERQHKAELRLDLVEARIKDLDKSMEYIRLLHNLSHNLVVEVTKLKVELDTLKSKFGILEKDQEHLRLRERAIEEKALK
jgi:hypothetical protein